MRIEQSHWTPKDGWHSARSCETPRTLTSTPHPARKDDWHSAAAMADAGLVLVFGGTDRLDADRLAELRARYPRTVQFGCSTAGEILGVNVHDDTLAATAIRFDRTPIRLAREPVADAEGSHAAGLALAAQLRREGLSHVLVFSAAGMAHEINNPIGYVGSNLGTLGGYIERLLHVLAAYERAAAALPEASPVLQEIAQARQEADLEYLKDDIRDLLRESGEGLTRVRRIVQDLKDFSHIEQGEWLLADLHAGLELTLNVVNNEIKYKAQVVKEYGELPMVECLPSQLNQVFMNLLVNAAHAMPESSP